MQEQPPYKITPEQGWARMAYVLDREMPVSRRSRRVIIFWWSAAAVTTAFMLSLFVLISDDKTTTPPITQQTSTQPSDRSKPGQSSNDNNTALPGKAETEMHGAASKPEQGSTKSIHTSPINKYQSQTQTTKSNVNNSKSNTFAIQDKSTDELFVGPDVNESQVLINVETDQKDLTHADVPEVNPSQLFGDRSMEVVEFLPLAGQEFFDPKAPVISLNEPITPYIQRQPLLSPYVGVGMMEGYFGGLGVHADAGLALNVMPRLSVTTGVGFNLYEPDVVFLGSDNKLRANADTDNILREDINTNGIGTYLPAEVVNNSSGSAISPFIETIMQWQVSAGLKYKLSKKFFVEAGGAYRFGTTSSSLYPIAEVDYGSTTGVFHVSNSFDSYKVLKSNSTLIYAGLGYKPGEKWEFNAYWNHAIDPYLVNNPVPAVTFEDRTDYIRGLNLGLKYLL